MEVVKIKTAKLNKADWNYKENDEEMAAKLVENIGRNGIMQVSVVYEEKGKLIVLDGNHRLDAYRHLKIKDVPCVNMGPISLAEAQRISIELNETRFENDVVRLAQAMKTINEEFSIEDMEKTLGFSGEDIRAMVEMDEVGWSDLKVNDGEAGVEDDGVHMATCPKCGKSFVKG